MFLTHVQLCMGTCLCVFVSCVWEYLRVYVCSYARVYVCEQVRICVCACVTVVRRCLRVCLSVCKYLYCVHAFVCKRWSARVRM
jgi:hypothetical protein